MTIQDPLNLREAGILQTIVQSYLETGEPVASQTLAKLAGAKLSPATIRNVMAALADRGFLAQPHPSAGRVPTEKAIRAYVKGLAVRVVSAELARMRARLSEARTVERRVEQSSMILTELTHNVGIVAAIPAQTGVLDSVELVALPANKILMVVVTRDGSVRNQIVEISRPLGEVNLASIRNYVNQNFAGWRLPDARRELERRLAQESAAYDSVLRALIELELRGLLDIALDPDVHLEGASNLVGLDLHLTREAMRALFRTLEEKKRILELLDRFLEQPVDGLGVQVGLAEAHPSMGGLSLVGVSVNLPNGLATRVAVLGPVRMDYARALSAVAHLQQALRQLPY